MNMIKNIKLIKKTKFIQMICGPTHLLIKICVKFIEKIILQTFKM
jgi:hypothetical protein